MRRTFAIILAALLCLAAFSACSLNKSDKPKETENADISIDNVDPTSPILSIGEQKITFAVYRALYESYLPYMQASGFDPLESESSLESFQDWLVDSLASDIVVLYQAEENGFELSPEQEEELAQTVEAELSELYETYMTYAEEDNIDDPTISVEVYFDNYISKMSEYYTGVSMSWEEYREEYAKEARRSYIIEHYKEFVCREFTPTEDDVADWYDAQLAVNKASYQDNPGKYKTDEDYFELYSGVKDDAYPILYVPGGYSRIMHILVTPQGELSEEYGNKLERMEEIKKLYGELALEDAVKGNDANAWELASLALEYKQLKEATDEEFASYTSAASEKISQAYAALGTGRPFVEVMLDFTEDKEVAGDGESEGCAAFRQKGQLISLEYTSTRDWSETFKAEFKKLTPGSYSGVFYDNGSYHIIYYVGDETAGAVPMESVYESIAAVCAANVGSLQWDALVEEWLNDPALVKNETLIRLPGADEVTRG